jgi:hypothetical protein
MAEKGFFSEDGAHASGAKTVLTLENDEVMVYEDFFCRWLAHASVSSPG